MYSRNVCRKYFGSLMKNMHMHDRIRLATTQDAVSIHNLHTRSVRGLCAADYPEEVIDGWLRGRSPEGYAGIAKHEMYVYEKDGVILGWSHVRPDMLVALFVDPDHARQGVGRALFQHAMQIIRRHTDQRIEFEATVTAEPFYERCGCRRLGASTIRKNNVDVTTVRMTLPDRSKPPVGGDGKPASQP
jgi:putative acetyltransferase